MILDGHDVEQLKHLVRDPNELKHLGKAAYEILCKDKWQPQGVESWPKAEHPRKLYEEDLVSVVLRATKYNVETASRLSRRYWTPRGAARLASLVGEYKAFYGGSCCAFQELMESEGRNVAEYLDLDQVRAVHGGPQSSYHKCKFWEKGNCRNGDHCRFEHRLCGQDWINPSSSSSEVRRKDPLPVSDKQQDAQNDGDIGEPPTDEGDVDEDQQAREDAAFQEQHQYGKGTGKGSTKGSFAGRRCWQHRTLAGCPYGDRRMFVHDSEVKADVQWEPGRRLDDDTRQQLREAGLNKMCFHYQLYHSCKHGADCGFSHVKLPEDKRKLLRDLVYGSHHRRDMLVQGGELPGKLKPQNSNIDGPTSGSSGAPRGATSSSALKGRLSLRFSRLRADQVDDGNPFDWVTHRAD